MTGRSTSRATQVDGKIHADKNSDYAAEYRTNVREASGWLQRVARFGIDLTGAIQEVEVPTELQDHRYIGPMVAFINSPHSGITGSRSPMYRRTFEFILKVASAENSLDWRFFGRALLEHLKSELYSESVIKQVMDDARRLFIKAAQTTEDVKVRREVRAIVGGRSAKGIDAGHWPVLRAVESAPIKSLEEVFEGDLTYTNQQYVDIFVGYSSAFINAWSDIRRRLREDYPDLYAKTYETVKRIGPQKLRDIEQKQTYSKRMFACKQEWLNLLDLNIEILVALDNPLLNMIAIAQYRKVKHFDRFAATIDLAGNGAAGFAKEMLLDDGTQSRPKTQWTIWNAGKRECTITLRLMFSLLDFLGPTIEEEICFTWLLCSRRIQLSNRDLLKRSQIDENAKSIWIRSYKGRNGTAQNISIQKNSKFGRSLRAFLHDYDQYEFRDEKVACIVSPYKSNFGRFHSTWNFHHLHFTEHVEGLGAYGVSDFNLTAMKEIYTLVVGFARLVGRASHYGDITKPEPKILNPSFITQSYVYAQEAERGGFSKSSTMQPTYDLEDAAEYERNAVNQFHTPEVREEVYRARSRDKLKLQKGKAFSVAVSAEMSNIANDIIDAWDQCTSRHSISDLIEVIGLRGFSSEARPETILAAAKAEKFIIEKSGLIKKNGKIYLFDSGLTARMMMEEIRHIEGELEGLFATQDIDKALNAWAKLCFLDLLMKRFGAASIKDASEKYGHLKGRIPHAPISEGGNSWIVK